MVWFHFVFHFTQLSLLWNCLTSDSEAHLNKPKLLFHEDFSHFLVNSQFYAPNFAQSITPAPREVELQVVLWKKLPPFNHLLDKYTEFYYYAKRNSKSTSPHKCAIWNSTFSHIWFCNFTACTDRCQAPELVLTNHLLCEITATTLASWQLLWFPSFVN